MEGDVVVVEGLLKRLQVVSMSLRFTKIITVTQLCVTVHPHQSCRVAPPDPRPSGRESRQEFDFLGRESTPEAKKGEKGPRVGRSGARIEIQKKPSSRQGELAKPRLAGLRWQRK